MEIKGLDYNTQREKLVMPEYGREVQKMVDYAISLPTKAERQRCAETIVRIMDLMVPQNHDNANYMQKLWDHLAIMSQFQLDIDYPYDVTNAHKMEVRPEPLPYPMSDIPIRHYGKMVFELLEQLRDMPDGPERDKLVRMTANQMKRDLVLWGHASNAEEKVADDLARFTDGDIQLDLEAFRFNKISEKDITATHRSRKRK